MRPAWADAGLTRIRSRDMHSGTAGVMTLSELIAAGEHGFKLLKLFPAEVAGGVAMLKSMAEPFADIGFCPTGDVTPKNIVDYLALSNVLCVGGSWLAPERLLDEKNWDGIRELAQVAVVTASNERQGK